MLQIVDLRGSVRNFSSIFRTVQWGANASRAIEFKNEHTEQRERPFNTQTPYFPRFKGKQLVRAATGRAAVRNLSIPELRYAIVSLFRIEILLYTQTTLIKKKIIENFILLIIFLENLFARDRDYIIKISSKNLLYLFHIYIKMNANAENIDYYNIKINYKITL